MKTTRILVLILITFLTFEISKAESDGITQVHSPNASYTDEDTDVSISSIYDSIVNNVKKINFKKDYNLLVGFSNEDYSDDNSDMGPLSIEGFHIGVLKNVAIENIAEDKYFGAQAGLFYNFLHGKEYFFATWDMTKHSLDIPLRLTFSYKTKEEITFYALAGPNINIGLIGNMKYTVSYGGKVEYDIYNTNNFNSNLGGYTSEDFENSKRFDLQLGFGAGFKYKKIGGQFNYDWGLLKTYTGNDTKNRDFKLSLFYNI